jgi:ubiquitin-conjugating enzyme E2 Z
MLGRMFSLTVGKAIAVDYDEKDIRNVRAVILGPPETPYQFGFFEVRYFYSAIRPSLLNSG